MMDCFLSFVNCKAINLTGVILQARIDEAEDCIDGLNGKVATTEKLRNRYQVELEDLQVEFERINGKVAVASKKLDTFDRVCKLQLL